MRFETILVGCVMAGLVFVHGCASPGPAGCRDFLRTLGDTAERCGDDREAVEAAVEDSFRAAYGAGCGGVDRIRDPDGVYDVFVETLTCEEYASLEDFPPECVDQLLYEM